MPNVNETSRESVATTTSPASASIALRQTCTIIGSPAMSARGLRGSRVAPIRAGMTIKGLAIGASFSF
jgi:hypothetical protein